MGSKMLQYFEFLLTSLSINDPVLTQIRNLCLVDATAYKVLLNTVIDTEVKAFVVHLIDYKLEPYASEITTTLDIVTLDQNLTRFSEYISVPELKNIAIKHFSPIWRVAAFVAFYILEADKIHNKKSKINLG